MHESAIRKKPNVPTSRSFLATSLALLWLSLASGFAEQFGLFTYEVNGDEVTITDYPEDATGNVEIPAEIEGRPVTALDFWAFFRCAELIEITIPASVTSINPYAFSDCGAVAIVVDPANPAFFSYTQ